MSNNSFARTFLVVFPGFVMSVVKLIYKYKEILYGSTSLVHSSLF